MSYVIDWISSYWNPVATIVATVVSLSLFIFNVYVYLDKKAKLSGVHINNATIDRGGNTTFELKCRNIGLEDLYVEDVSANINKESIKFINTMEISDDSSGLYNYPLKLTENESIDATHISCSALKKYVTGNSVRGSIIIETSANNIKKDIKFEFESD